MFDVLKTTFTFRLWDREDSNVMYVRHVAFTHISHTGLIDESLTTLATGTRWIFIFTYNYWTSAHTHTHTHTNTNTIYTALCWLRKHATRRHNPTEFNKRGKKVRDKLLFCFSKKFTFRVTLVVSWSQKKFRCTWHMYSIYSHVLMSAHCGTHTFTELNAQHFLEMNPSSPICLPQHHIRMHKQAQT